MKRKKERQHRGFILVGAFLLLALGFSALCLLVAAQNHQKLWRLRMERNREARSQVQRLTSISHRIVTRLMQDKLPETEILLRMVQWQALLRECAGKEYEACSIEINHQDLETDPFLPLRMNLDLSIFIQDHDPGMAHRVMLRGLFCSGRFPVGAVPLLLAQEESRPVPFDSSFSRITLADDTSSCAPGSSPPAAEWIDPLPFLSIPLGIPLETLTWEDFVTLLGLNPSAPTPEGIYPFFAEDRLNALVAIGTVDRMVLSQRENEQKIEIFQGESQTTLRYGMNPPYCILNGQELSSASPYAENLMIFGNILSLEQKGEDGLASFCSLYLYVNGAIRISTPLTAASSADGRDKGFITLVAARTEKAPSSLPSEIFIDFKNRIDMDAQLISTGTIRSAGELHLNGSLFASAFQGKQPEIVHRETERELPVGPEIRFFKALHCLGIEEVYHEVD